jgi:hypothetical protein
MENGLKFIIFVCSVSNSKQVTDISICLHSNQKSMCIDVGKWIYADESYMLTAIDIYPCGTC